MRSTRLRETTSRRALRKEGALEDVGPEDGCMGSNIIGMWTKIPT